MIQQQTYVDIADNSGAKTGMCIKVLRGSSSKGKFKRKVAHVGDVIEWTNKDIFDHTATAKNGEFDVVIPAGKKVRVVLKHAGTFDYYCRLHPNMTARVTVEK